MRGLWNVRTQGISPGLGLLVWDWIVAAATLLLTICFLVDRPRHWRAARLLGGGLIVLSV